LLGHERHTGLRKGPATLADEHGHSGAPNQGEVKQAPEHQRVNVVQRPQKAEGQGRVSPVQVVGDVDQGEGGVGGLNQALELKDQPEERSYEAEAV
jgi:hypothetical protein